MASLEIRADIVEKHRSLFGDKTVNGRKVNVEDLITRMTLATKDQFRTLLGARHEFQEQVGRRERAYAFLPPDARITDADGHTVTVRDIRQGMLDGFFGRKTPQAWRLNPSVPIPPETMKPGLEGTGPAIDLGMAMGALNTGALYTPQQEGKRPAPEVFDRAAP
jgi:malate synthase